jgi:hypothetical protein
MIVVTALQDGAPLILIETDQYFREDNSLLITVET